MLKSRPSVLAKPVAVDDATGVLVVFVGDVDGTVVEELPLVVVDTFVVDTFVVVVSRVEVDVGLVEDADEVATPG
jgi:hypothetical protein